MKKALALILCLVMLLGVFPMSAAFAEGETKETASESRNDEESSELKDSDDSDKFSGMEHISTNEAVLDRYLLKAGFPQDTVDMLCVEDKQELFNAHAVADSVAVVHGIFTEDYQIEFEINGDGSVSIDNDNLAKFQELLNKPEVVEKVLVDKGDVENEEIMTTTNSMPNAVNSLAQMPIEDSLMTLSNFTGSTVVSQISYKPVYGQMVCYKKIVYTWSWSYDPILTLTDKIGVAWSGGFTGYNYKWTYERWEQWRRDPSKPTWASGNMYWSRSYKTQGTDIHECDLEKGFGVEIDIQKGPGAAFGKRHQGTVTASLRKATTTNCSLSAMGQYFHKTVALTGGSLSFSASKTGPSVSIGISWGWTWDKSPVKTYAFWERY